MASTNQTTHYGLSQYIGTDKPTYLTDYNQDMSKIDEGIYSAKEESAVNTESIGVLSNLTTTNKSNLVSAINEVHTESGAIGNLSDLTTENKASVVSAINEVNSKTDTIGSLTDLTTTNKTNVVSAINEVDSDIGNLANLETTSKINSVSAINEVHQNIGVLANLLTNVKTDAVSAINEVHDEATIESNFDSTNNRGYIKYSDGTMICYGDVVGTGSRVDYWTNYDKISVNNIPFGETFLASPFVIVCAYGNASLSADLERDSTTTFNVNVYKPKNTNNNDYSVYWIAIGRWK